MGLNTEYITFPSRLDRSRYVHERFNGYLKESVLDVGCFEAPLRRLLSDASYTGVDIAGSPDVELNLETCDRLPFDADSYHCVICIDVLEHLDNLHAVFQELVRVTKKFLIVSLPNCWCDARTRLDRGRGSFAHYGLPLQRPVDRHKWFFSLTEAKQFLEGKSGENDLSVLELFVTEKPRNVFVTFSRKLRYLGESYNNRYTQTIWIVYEKNNPNGTSTAKWGNC